MNVVAEEIESLVIDIHDADIGELNEAKEQLRERFPLEDDDSWPDALLVKSIIDAAICNKVDIKRQKR
jgi:hypothetical protein